MGLSARPLPPIQAQRTQGRRVKLTPRVERTPRVSGPRGVLPAPSGGPRPRPRISQTLIIPARGVRPGHGVITTVTRQVRVRIPVGHWQLDIGRLSSLLVLQRRVPSVIAEAERAPEGAVRERGKPPRSPTPSTQRLTAPGPRAKPAAARPLTAKRRRA